MHRRCQHATQNPLNPWFVFPRTSLPNGIKVAARYRTVSRLFWAIAQAHLGEIPPNPLFLSGAWGLSANKCPRPGAFRPRWGTGAKPRAGPLSCAVNWVTHRSNSKENPKSPLSNHGNARTNPGIFVILAPSPREGDIDQKTNAGTDSKPFRRGLLASSSTRRPKVSPRRSTTTTRPDPFSMTTATKRPPSAN